MVISADGRGEEGESCDDDDDDTNLHPSFVDNTMRMRSPKGIVIELAYNYQSNSSTKFKTEWSANGFSDVWRTDVPKGSL